MGTKLNHILFIGNYILIYNIWAPQKIICKANYNLHVLDELTIARNPVVNSFLKILIPCCFNLCLSMDKTFKYFENVKVRE